MTALMPVAAAPSELSYLSYAEKMKRFGEEIDAIRIRAEADFATVKKVVVWCFAARELTESAGWRAVPLFP